MFPRLPPLTNPELPHPDVALASPRGLPRPVAALANLPRPAAVLADPPRPIVALADQQVRRNPANVVLTSPQGLPRPAVVLTDPPRPVAALIDPPRPVVALADQPVRRNPANVVMESPPTCRRMANAPHPELFSQHLPPLIVFINLPPIFPAQATGIVQQARALSVLFKSRLPWRFRRNVPA